MYDLPELRAALDRLWAALSRALVGAPGALVHDRAPEALWVDEGLFVSQCCGYDLVNRHAGILRPLVTPRYTAPGCRGTDYCSQLVVAEGSAIAELSEARGAVCAVNGFESHSGMNALRALVAPLHRGGRFFSHVTLCGSHADSLAAVAGGEADICAVDCVSHALLERHRPAALAGTRILCQSASAPAIPFVTRIDRGAEFAARLQAALLKILGDPELGDARRELLIDGGEIVTIEAYARITEMETEAAASGYPQLR
ncbi:MAG: PhnD/SsuA/transferrin family substrate-binding protein [Alphaproteobacteria bacterium]|jgi:ABC-type phosphate/phosphonate transport system substrate-binding protein|nr:PhnD/SsuA/transferrin family substrate-binding protein [Alphaproteobacteria bacterium]MDP6589495.1 PhnD/SsuA/transferrin family substrate-binding protein [Alphaproteobacteria bacterium]MDP6818200.1 PhnD/SsuA/transferrin family substrate-binding protein [Alphaproteobacteria bacterium]